MKTRINKDKLTKVKASPSGRIARVAAKPKRQRAENKQKSTYTSKTSEFLYRNLFENMLNGFAYCKMIYEQGRPVDFIYLDVNNAFESLTGLNDVVGKKVSEVIPGIQKTDPELFEIYSRVALTGSPERFESYVEALKMWFLISVYSPKKNYFVAVFDVITERKRAEEMREHLAAIVEASDDAIIGKTLDGIITSWNPGAQWLYGYSAEEVIGQSISLLIPPDLTDELPEILYKIAHGESVEHYETIRLKKGGARVDVAITVSPIKDSSGRVIGASSIGRDITVRKQAEEALNTASRYNRSLIEVNLDPLVTIGLDGRITDVNTATETVTGFTRTEIIGTDFSDYFIEPEKAKAGYKKVFQDGSVKDYPLEIQHRDGHVTSVLYNASVFRDENGKILGVFAAAHDITERKQAEEALRESNERFRTAFQYSADGMALVSPAGRWIKVNASMCKFIGYSEEELLTKTFQDITHPDDLDIDLNHFRDLTDGNIDFYKMEKRYIHKDGKIIWGLLAVVPVRGNDGVPLYFLRQIQDITVSKQVEDELRKAHDELELQIQLRTSALSQANMLLQTLLDNMPDQIYFKDSQSRFIKNSWAQAAALGLSDPSQVVGKTDFDFFPHAQQSFTEEQEIIRSGKPLVDFEELVAWPDGHETWVSTTKVPLRDPEDKIIGTMGISRDITDRKRNEDALRRANEELEAFSYSVSHDLRAPLRGIDGWSQALLEDYGDKLDEQGQEFIKRVRFETQHMGELIDALLQLSRITRAEMNIQPVDLSAAARSIAARLQEIEPQRHVEFKIQEGLSIKGDAHLLDIALTNLLGNAFKFTCKIPNAKIEFGQNITDNQRTFFVRDNGAGFDMAFAKNLFGAFQRMHTASEFPGTGIGLTTVQRIIHRHGGQVWAESVVNEGATFFFTIEENI